MSNAMSTGLRGISSDGKFVVQTRRGSGYMILRRQDEEQGRGWDNVAETAYYGDACALMDQVSAQEVR